MTTFELIFKQINLINEQLFNNIECSRKNMNLVENQENSSPEKEVAISITTFEI